MDRASKKMSRSVAPSSAMRESGTSLSTLLRNLATTFEEEIDAGSWLLDLCRKHDTNADDVADLIEGARSGDRISTNHPLIQELRRTGMHLSTVDILITEVRELGIHVVQPTDVTATEIYTPTTIAGKQNRILQLALKNIVEEQVRTGEYHNLRHTPRPDKAMLLGQNKAYVRIYPYCSMSYDLPPAMRRTQTGEICFYIDGRLINSSDYREGMIMRDKGLSFLPGSPLNIDVFVKGIQRVLHPRLNDLKQDLARGKYQTCVATLLHAIDDNLVMLRDRSIDRGYRAYPV